MEHRYVSVCSTYEGMTAYGIACLEKSDGSIRIAEGYMDLCADGTRTAGLAKLCNELQLDPVHLRDVVDDFLLML